MYIALILFAFVFFTLLLLIGYTTIFGRKLQLSRRLRILTSDSDAEILEAVEAPVAPGSIKGKRNVNLVGLLGKFLPMERYLEGKKQLIVSAKLLLKPEELVGVSVIAAVLALIVGQLFFGNLLIAVVLAIIAFKVPTGYVKSLKTKRIRKLAEQLPEALNILSNGLRAGLSFIQAVSVVAKEMDAPLADDFNKILRDNMLGKDLEETLSEFAEKAENENVDILVTAILIQRQVGGNLSEILDNISETIRDRIKLMGDVRSMTAQSKISALIIGCIPVGIVVVINLINHEFMKPLFTTLIGNVLLGAAILMQLIGIFLIVQMLKIKV